MKKKKPTELVEKDCFCPACQQEHKREVPVDCGPEPVWLICKGCAFHACSFGEE